MVVRFADLSLGCPVFLCTPLFLALVVLPHWLSPFFLGSWNFSLKALNPDAGRLDPIKGLSRLFPGAGWLSS
jgi:flagellar biosynthetic protein FlhB